jgi:alpha-aminoadipic semialdehyde synthase
MYWDNSFPRLVSIRQANELHSAGRLPLLGVCDITCDLRGSVEFLTVGRQSL